MTSTNAKGEPIYNVGMTDAEMEELIRLIDDDEVDEDFLKGIRKKLAHKRKLLGARVRKQQAR